MPNIKLNYKHTNITKRMIQDYAKEVEKNHKELHDRALDDEDFVGWLELPTDYNKEKVLEMILHGECGQFNPILIECLQEISSRIRSECYDEEQET